MSKLVARLRNWLSHNRFPIGLSFILVAIEVALFLLLRVSGGANGRWLGDMVMVPTDQALYLGFIEQIRIGGTHLQNLFAPVYGSGAILHPFYQLLGYVARFTQWSPIMVHEVARWLVAISAVFALHTVSRALTRSERDAAWATGTVTLAGGFGWMYLVWKFALGATRVTELIPDLKGEAFFFPTLLWGAHIAFVWAMLPFCLWLIDRGIRLNNRRATLAAACLTGFLIWIFPYCTLLLAIYIPAILVLNAPRHSLRQFIYYCLSRAWPYLIGAPLGILPHVWNQLGNPDRRYLLLQNDLPLEPYLAWILAFLPWVLLLLWRYRRRIRLTPEERWLAVWLGCVIIAIALPFKWDRKLTEGLSAGIIWLGLPILFRIRDWLKKNLGLFGVIGISLAMLMSPLRLILFQVDWAISHTADHARLYASNDTDRAWTWIRERTPIDTVVFPDTQWTGLWTALNTDRHIWIGHEFETPDIETKRLVLQTVMETGSLDEALQAIEQSGATVVLATDAERATRLHEILKGTTDDSLRREWTELPFGTATVWQKR